MARFEFEDLASGIPTGLGPEVSLCHARPRILTHSHAYTVQFTTRLDYLVQFDVETVATLTTGSENMSYVTESLATTSF